MPVSYGPPPIIAGERWLKPWRKVVKSESIGWWNLLGRYHDFFLTLECGHMVQRRARTAPKRVRCDGCDLVLDTKSKV